MCFKDGYTLVHVGLQHLVVDVGQTLAGDVLLCKGSSIGHLLVVQTLAHQYETVACGCGTQAVQHAGLGGGSLGAFHSLGQTVGACVSICLVGLNQAHIGRECLFIALLCSLEQGSGSLVIGTADQCLQGLCIALLPCLLQVAYRLVGGRGGQGGVESCRILGSLHGFADGGIALVGCQIVYGSHEHFLEIGHLAVGGLVEQTGSLVHLTSGDYTGECFQCSIGQCGIIALHHFQYHGCHSLDAAALCQAKQGEFLFAGSLLKGLHDRLGKVALHALQRVQCLCAVVGLQGSQQCSDGLVATDASGRFDGHGCGGLSFLDFLQYQRQLAHGLVVAQPPQHVFFAFVGEGFVFFAHLGNGGIVRVVGGQLECLHAVGAVLALECLEYDVGTVAACSLYVVIELGIGSRTCMGRVFNGFAVRGNQAQLALQKFLCCLVGGG